MVANNDKAKEKGDSFGAAGRWIKESVERLNLSPLVYEHLGNCLLYTSWRCVSVYS